MTHYMLVAWYDKWHDVLGVFTSLNKAKQAAENHTPPHETGGWRVLWKEETQHPDGKPYSYTGTIPKSITLRTGIVIVQWSIVPCSLNTFWGKS